MTSYGFAIDVWSAAVVSFEIASLLHFIEAHARGVGQQLGDIACRLGSAPEPFASELPRRGLTDRRLEPCDKVLSEPWLGLVVSGLTWEASKRSSAEHAVGLSMWDVVDTSAAGAGGAAVHDAKPPLESPASPRESEKQWPMQLGRVSTGNREQPLGRDQTCNCSGNCGQPRHSRHKCSRPFAVVGSKLCHLCECSWLGCHCPRNRSDYCFAHKKIVSALSETWRIVQAAGAVNSELVPCDVPSFSLFYAAYRKCFRELLTVAFVKEPQATELFMAAVGDIRSMVGEARRDHVWNAWRKVVEQVASAGQHLVTLQQLADQGTARYSCFGRTMTLIGIVEPVEDDAASSPVAGDTFRLGLLGLVYRFCADRKKFDQYYSDLEAAEVAWGTVLEAKRWPDFNDF